MRKLLPLIVLLPLLAGCDFFTRNDGRLDLSITDAPVDGATAVVVRFSGVELEHEDGDEEIFDFDSPRNIDLLALAGGDSVRLLDDVRLPSGRYDRIRLKIVTSRTGTESYIDLPDGRHPLFMPTSAEGGLVLDGDFEIPDDADEAQAFTIDFDLRKSVRTPEDSSDTYVLRPSLRLVEDSRAGSIAGTVATARATASGCVPAVYAYSGSSVTPDDVDGNAIEPLSSAKVMLVGGNYRYEIAFLPAGSYTVAYTCDADDDDPADNDTLVFEAGNTTVSADETATVNF